MNSASSIDDFTRVTILGVLGQRRKTQGGGSSSLNLIMISLRCSKRWSKSCSLLRDLRTT